MDVVLHLDIEAPPTFPFFPIHTDIFSRRTFSFLFFSVFSVQVSIFHNPFPQFYMIILSFLLILHIHLDNFSPPRIFLFLSSDSKKKRKTSREEIKFQVFSHSARKKSVRRNVLIIKGGHALPVCISQIIRPTWKTPCFPVFFLFPSFLSFLDPEARHYPSHKFNYPFLTKDFHQTLQLQIH